MIIFVGALYLSRLGARATRAALERRRVDSELTLLMARIAPWIIIIFGTIWALDQVNFDVTGFVAGLGIIGFTVGFALKDIAENFVAGYFDSLDAVVKGIKAAFEREEINIPYPVRTVYRQRV